jgi:hypothetical protein
MFACRVTCGRSGIFARNGGEGTIIGGADFVQNLVGRVDDVGPERKILSESELHSEVIVEGE